jgi:hypothetical protein
MMYRVIATTLPVRVLGLEYTLLYGAEFTPDASEAESKGELWVPLRGAQIEQHIAAQRIARL